MQHAGGIRHLSLDLWLTIIRSDPAFKPARARLAIRHFGIAASEEKVLETFQHFDKLFNAVNEKTGCNLHLFEMLYVILAQLGVDVEGLPVTRLEAFYVASEGLFFEHHPRLMDGAVPDVLRSLRGEGLTVSLLSNTAFILGRTLRKLMPRIGLEDCFDFQLYSDETGHSKPATEMYAMLYRRAAELRPLQPSEILHIGDNRIADYDGARAAGMQAALLVPDEQTLSSLLLPLSCIPASRSTI